jgi:hypothetical protein
VYRYQGLVTFDDGGGPALAALLRPEFHSQSHVVKWDGSSWTELAGVSGPTSLLALDAVGGPALHVNAGGLRRWNGSSWSPDVALGAAYGGVGDLTRFDDGSGSAIYAGGTFQVTNRVVRLAKLVGEPGTRSASR